MKNVAKDWSSNIILLKYVMLYLYIEYLNKIYEKFITQKNILNLK